MAETGQHEHKPTQDSAKPEQEPMNPGRAPNWITDMYDKMNIPVKLLDGMLIALGLFIVLLFVFGNRIQLGL